MYPIYIDIDTLKKNKDLFLKNPPYVVRPPIPYIDVNKNQGLRDQVTHYFLRKLLKDLKNTNNSKLKNYKNIIEGEDGYIIVYNLLRIYTKKYRKNWYDLKSMETEIRRFMAKKLIELD